VRGKRYRLNTPTLAIMVRDGHKVPVTIPKGGEIVVIDDAFDGHRLLAVQWEGETVMTFAIDIRERGERLDAASSPW